MGRRARMWGLMVLGVAGVLLTALVILWLIGRHNLYSFYVREYGSRLARVMISEPRLRKGMTAKKVEQVVGLPDNDDRTNVWFWMIIRGDHSPSAATDKKWRDMYWSKEHIGCMGEGYFLLFDNGLLLTPTLVKVPDADPWETLNYTGRDGEKILGPKHESQSPDHSH